LIIGAIERVDMSEDTLFTQIVAGDIPSYTVYEDETTYAFLDANPLAPGHTLVIPKEPHERLNDVPPDVAADVFSVLGEIAAAVEDAVDADASTIALNNGEAAGQEVPHVHCHIIPQFEDDTARPIHALFDGADLSEDQMETIAQRARDNQ
jgi:histidine triad (HIT) family protein